MVGTSNKMANMDLNSNCCSIGTLEKLKLLYRDNVEEYTLYQCVKCQRHWLYKKLEEDWHNNILLHENNYKAWYIRVATEDLQYVLNLAFDQMFWTSDYVYISTSESKITLGNKAEGSS